MSDIFNVVEVSTRRRLQYSFTAIYEKAEESYI